MPKAMLSTLDWAIIGGYLAGLVLLALFLSRGQKSARDYYLGSNRMGALPVALSTMATQCSTNSLLGVPAFVALAAGGGLVWLQYEIAVPLAMIVLMAVLFPVLRSLRLISIYDYTERRYGVATRTTLSILFQLLRAFATGVTVYGVSLVLVAALDIAFWQAVLLLGGVTVIYDMLGGMKGVIVSDVLQIFLLFGAVVLGLWFAVDLAGGLGAIRESVDPARLQALDFSGHGFGDGETFAFWPMLIGGFFLYMAYYGCDQTQAQRALSTSSLSGTNRALYLGGLLRFPLVLTYSLFGVALAAYMASDPAFFDLLREASAGLPTVNKETGYDANLAVPVFVLAHFPSGLLGLVLVGLVAAAMSSLDSTLNSLSAVTMDDILGRFFLREPTDRQVLWLSKLTTLFWGALTLAFSFVVGELAATIVESVNMVGSLLNGPLLAVFLLGVLAGRVNEAGILSGLAAGLLFNLGLALFAPEVSWLWWNVTGFVACAGVAATVSAFTKAPEANRLHGLLWKDRPRACPSHDTRSNWGPYYAILGAYALVIVGVLWLLQPQGA